MKNQNENPIIVGLDIGTTKVVMIVGRRNEFGKIEVLAFGRADSKGMNGAEVVNIVDVSNAIKQALQNCYESNKEMFYNNATKNYEGIKDVIVGIAGQHICSRQEYATLNRGNSIDEITFQEIEDLRKTQYQHFIEPGDEIINVIARNYKLDSKHIVNDPVGCAARRVDATYHIITGNQDEIRKICKAVERAGLTIENLYLQPLASARSVLTESSKEKGVVIVDIGGGTTDIAVFQNGTLSHTSVINFAGNFITKNIYNDLHIFRYEEAEELKKQFGSCIPDKVKTDVYITLQGEKGMQPSKISIYNLANNINHSVINIIKHINYNLTNNGFDTKTLHGGIFITGGSALLNHLKPLMAHETCLQTQIGVPNEHLAENYKPGADHPEFATCYGLILYGFELYDNQLLELQGQEDVNNIALPEDKPIIEKEAETPVYEAISTPINNAPKKDKSYLDAFLDVMKNEFKGSDEKL